MTTNLLSVWSTIGSVALAIVILLVMITIHEFGHYVAGKIFHFKINEFSIGFGPAIFKHKNKKTGELFAVRCIPLGGYCAFDGEDGLDEEEEHAASKENETQTNDRVFIEDGFSEQPGEVPETAERSQSYEPVQTSQTAETNETPETAKTEEGESKKTDDEGKFTNKPCWQRIIVLVAGAFMNYLLALFLIVVCFFSYGQTMIAVYEMEESAEFSSEYSLQDYDIILRADGKGVYLTTDIVSAVNGKKAYDLVEFTVSRVTEWGENESGARVALGRETVTVSVMLRADVNVNNSTEIDGAYAALGVKYSEEDGGYMMASSLCKFGFFETIGRSFVYSFKLAGSILKVLGELLTGRLGLSAVGGPVTTITMTSQVVSLGFRYFLEIAAYIGVNLAVFNLLPIPALDGCKVIFTLIEWIRGKPVNRKVEAVIDFAGLLFLLGFAILVDILQFV